MLTFDAMQKNKVEAKELLEKLQTLTDEQKDVVLGVIEGIRLGANITKSDIRETA